MTDQRRMRLILAVLAAAPLAAGVWLERGAAVSADEPESSEPEDWGRGDLAISEKEYYRERVSHVFSRWGETARLHRLGQAYNVYLVVDGNKPAIWLEENGRVLESDYAEFPKNMRWEVYRTTPEGKERLSGLVRLKIGVPYRGRRAALAEGIWLWGYGRGSEHITVYLSASGPCTTDYSESPPNIRYRGEYPKDREFAESIIVGEAEYDDYQRSLGGEAGGQGEVVTLVSEPNVSQWLKVEKRLYWEIERRIVERNYVVVSLKIEAWAGRGTGRGELLSGEKSGFIRQRPREKAPDLLLKIDYVGDGVWYVQGIEKHPERIGKELSLEFLVAAKGEIAKDRYRVLLAEARRKYSAVRKWRAKWTASLASGVKLEVAGICEFPSVGRKWWGPDGKGLDYEPIYYLDGPAAEQFSVTEYFDQSPGTRPMEVAFGISWPKGPLQDRRFEILVDEEELSRAGSLAEDEVWVLPYRFDLGQQEFNATIRASVDNVTFETATFRNISLAAGRDTGFVIEVEKPGRPGKGRE
ncbi:MAG TPA: hypothetical protein VMX13_16010 [Sedimentisphaerales bacterium]|nr:hypothetical protein [Sedimentisphaerales bacterium]